MNIKNLYFFALVFFLFYGCTRQSEPISPEGARIQFKMVDEPGDFEEVNVDVQDVMINWSDDDDAGWESLEDVQTGIYNLLELTGGFYALLADEEIPPGFLKQARLILGENNTVKVDGEIHELKTPSAQQSGLKLQINTEIVAGVEYSFTFDWDVEESIVIAGDSGKYNLKPVIRVSSEAESGGISGFVLPDDVQCLVTASNGTESISTYTHDSGAFLIEGVPEGTYTVTIVPDVDSGYETLEIQDVSVTLGAVTEMGTLELEEIMQAARIQFILVDDPGDYEEVNVDIQDVRINWSDDDAGWESLEDVQTGIYDLLELTGGNFALLADQEISPGFLKQARLILGEDNTIKVDGELHDLSTPSAQQSGLKLQINTEIVEGVEYSFILDWDVEESIVKAGNSGKYNLKPVIRVSSQAETGAISGTVNPTDVLCLVTATDASGSISTYTNDSGAFLIQGVPEGTYTITIEPDVNSGFGTVEIQDVSVTLGSVTDVGTTELQ